MTDGSASYKGADKIFASHETVDHRRKENAQGDVHVNSAESYFGLLNRGIVGTYSDVSKRHLHRYLAEFDFRWNQRTVADGTRAGLAAQEAEGKRLTFAPLRSSTSAAVRRNLLQAARRLLDIDLAGFARAQDLESVGRLARTTWLRYGHGRRRHRLLVGLGATGYPHVARHGPEAK